VPLQLHRHQTEAIRAARSGRNYVLTTGTGSGKSLAYIIPIVDQVLRHGSGKGIKAIVVYPMNALANSQVKELEKFLMVGYPEGKPAVTFARYTGQEKEEERKEILANPPDILLTNYVMLELILTRPRDRKVIAAAEDLRFLVLDELHTYRGRQGADVAMLVRRVRDGLSRGHLQCVGTSATLAGGGGFEEQRREVSKVATRLFGDEVAPECVIGETLRRSTPWRDPADSTYVEELRRAVADVDRPLPTDYDSFAEDPLASWIETTFGVEERDGQLVRAVPRSVGSSAGQAEAGDMLGHTGAAHDLAELTGLDERACEHAIQRMLLAGAACEPKPGTNTRPFAFRLHQFISRGDTVYATVEPPAARHITVYGQQFAPGGDGRRLLLPVAFCRECGQEYYTVWRNPADTFEESPAAAYSQRRLTQLTDEEDAEPGFLFLSETSDWPDDPEQTLDHVPTTGWMRRAFRKDRRDWVPRLVRVEPDGSEGRGGVDCHYMPARSASVLTAASRTRSPSGRHRQAWVAGRPRDGARRRRC